MESSCICDVQRTIERRWARNLTGEASRWRLTKAMFSMAGNAHVHICGSLCHVCADMSVEENVKEAASEPKL
jgi:hypothetical protein